MTTETHDIVPDDVDADEFRSRQAKTSTTDDEDRTACPECGGTNIRMVGVGYCHRTYDATNGKACDKCGHKWGGTDRRPTKTTRFEE